MKKLVILVVLLGALGGGGYFAYNKFMKKPAVDIAEAEVVAEEVAEAHSYTPELFKLKPITVSLYNKNNQVSHLYGLEMALELYDESILEDIEKLRPLLRDAVMKFLIKLSKSAPRLLEDEVFIRKKLLDIGNAIIKQSLEEQLPKEQLPVNTIHIRSIGVTKSVR